MLRSVTVLAAWLSGVAADRWGGDETTAATDPPPAPVAKPSTLINAIRTSSTKAGPLLPLTKDKVELMAFAAELTQAVYYQGNTNCDAANDPQGPDCNKFNPGYEHLGFNALYANEIASGEMTVLNSADEVDANLLLDIGEFCFVVWRATISFDPTSATTVQDWFYRNFDVDNREVAPIGHTETCSVHEGIYEAYQGGEGNTNHLEEQIIQFVDACMDGNAATEPALHLGDGETEGWGGDETTAATTTAATTAAPPAPNKQLVLVGHSQGAGAAMMGALRFADRNPLSIALAGAPILQSGEECPAINRDHIWRVVNTENNADDTELMYDLVRRYDITSYIVSVLDLISHS